MNRVCVFDIDGVLADPTRRIREAARRARVAVHDIIARYPRSPRFWKFFLSEEMLELDEPRRVGIELLRRRIMEGYGILIVTGRPEKLRRATLKQLLSFGISKSDIDKILMRKRGDFRREHIVKRDLLKIFIDENPGYLISEIHDDNPDSLEAMGRIARNALLILHFNNTYTIYRR